jgi:Mor family transcriptional regulator
MSEERKIISEIEINDLQEQHRPIAECVGMEGFLKLVEAFGGSSIYIPQMREVVKMRVYRQISEEFDGTNIKALANKYAVSESTVYNVVREQIQNGSYRHPQIPGQMSIADMLNNSIV